MDSRLEYWIESTRSALEEVNRVEEFTDEEIKIMAEALQLGAEMESMAFGENCIPSPATTKLEEEREKHKHEVSELEGNLEKRSESYKNLFARQHGLYPTEVFINQDGVAEWDGKRIR